ncbi:TetR/AcrR family transcriptional regulator [Desulfoluna butyratoxydans]|uniref:Beti-type transcriptional repressor c-terminal n=1 Tax=Desulfoluna butyratoxydans TaxID=231438 RepID=A0A4U8YLB1_9BACT|nr:TetR/AcrR family transcriptional regulator [Desulfoluna butyratoxydans]VFQ44471.1 beti-type transcriptional repressor c-terminal [Desulfoluna butyratoxydans]
MPKIVDKEARREEIAEKAAHLFFLEGYENTPVRAITEAAGISKGSFYDYFSSKEEILGFIAEARFRKWRDLFEGAVRSVEGQGAAAELSAVVTEAIRSVASLTPHTVNMLDLWRMAMRGRGASDLAHAMDRAMAELRAILETVVDKGKAAGEFRGDTDSRATAVGVLGLVSGLTMHVNMMNTTPMDPSHMAEKTCGLILSGIEIKAL